MVDFSRPQPFNVDLAAREIADDTGARSMPVPPRLYDPPVRPVIEAEAEIYPERRHGVMGPRMRRPTWKARS